MRVGGGGGHNRGRVLGGSWDSSSEILRRLKVRSLGAKPKSAEE